MDDDDDANNNNNNIIIDNENEQQQQQQQDAEQEQEQQVAFANVDARRTRRLKLMSVLERFNKYPNRTKNKTDELVETFLENLGDDIHDMLCDNDTEDENYDGLDSDRDTEAEVEAIVRFFPETLSRKKELVRHNESFYPIQLLAFVRRREDVSWGFNLKGVSFIPLLARLAIEFGVLFDGEEERGGLLCQDYENENENVLHYLVASDRSEHRELVDDKYLQVLMQLRKKGLLKKEDIRSYGLLNEFCLYYYFAEKRFRFLIEWDPNALIQPNRGYGDVPLDRFATNFFIGRFQIVFEYGILYYPTKKGINLLFRKGNILNYRGETPFQRACEHHGVDEVTKVVEDTLIRHTYTSADNNASPLNIEDAILTAAIDQNIHLDCVYFLMRRQPDILQKLLSSTTTAAVAMDNNNNNNNNIGNESINGNNDDNDNLDKTKTNPKKRKQTEKSL